MRHVNLAYHESCENEQVQAIANLKTHLLDSWHFTVKLEIKAGSIDYSGLL